jgi:hypothetical protein
MPQDTINDNIFKLNLKVVSRNAGRKEYVFLPHSEKAAQRICKLCLWIAQGDLKRLTSEFATFPVYASSIQKMVEPKPTARIMFWSKLIERHLAIRKDPSYYCSRYILESCKTVVGCYGHVVTCYSVTAIDAQYMLAYLPVRWIASYTHSSSNKGFQNWQAWIEALFATHSPCAVCSAGIQYKADKDKDQQRTGYSTLMAFGGLKGSAWSGALRLWMHLLLLLVVVGFSPALNMASSTRSS